jgi:hypothetical protein
MLTVDLAEKYTKTQADYFLDSPKLRSFPPDKMDTESIHASKPAHSKIPRSFLPNQGNIINKDSLISFLRIINPNNLEAAYQELKKIWLQDGIFTPHLVSKKILTGKLTNPLQKISLLEGGLEISLKSLLEKLLASTKSRLRHKLSNYSMDGDLMLALADAYFHESKQNLSLVFGDFVNIKGTNLYFEALLEKTLGEKLNPSERRKKAECLTDLACKHISKLIREEIIQESKRYFDIDPENIGFFGMGGDEIGIISGIEKERLNPILDKIIHKVIREVDLMLLNNHKHTKEGKSPGFGISLGAVDFRDLDPRFNRKDLLVLAEHEAEKRNTNKERTYKDPLNFNLLSGIEAENRLRAFLKFIKASDIEIHEEDQMNFDTLPETRSKDFDTRSPIITRMQNLFHRNPNLSPEDRNTILAAATRLIKTDFATGLQLDQDLPYYIRALNEDVKLLVERGKDQKISRELRILNIGFENLSVLNHHLKNHEITNYILRYLSQIIKDSLAQEGLRICSGLTFTKSGGKFLILIPNFREDQNANRKIFLSELEQKKLCEKLGKTISWKVETEINKQNIRGLLKKIQAKFPELKLDSQTLEGLKLDIRVKDLENPRRKDEYGVAIYYSHRQVGTNDYKAQIEKTWEILEEKTQNSRRLVQKKPKKSLMKVLWENIKEILKKLIPTKS